MNRATKIIELPALTVDFLKADGVLIDNIFAGLWRGIGMKALLGRAGFAKRSGAPIGEVVFALILWVWLKTESIGMFTRDGLQGSMGKDVLYDTMNREDLDWRGLHRQVARKAVSGFKNAGAAAFVLDDTVQQRSGKKMPGVSCHFDHTDGRYVMGQQVLTLGLSTEQGFVPLDCELFISQSKATALHQPFDDGRSTAAKRYAVAAGHTKPDMAESMIKRALGAGYQAYYLLADAWFGTKTMIRLTEETALVPIFRMKKNALKYRMPGGAEMDVKALYRLCVRKNWQAVHGQKYVAKTVDVELNLAEAKGAEQWVKVRLLFVRGTADGKHDWAVFLTTDTALSAGKILELYSMRWAIEVYFKEAKQHLGFLKEQSNHYAAYVASVHLAAIRFCLLVLAKQSQGTDNVAEVRRSLCANSLDISYAGKLWQVFRAVISGALDSIKAILGDALPLVMEAIDAHMECLFVQVLQLDPKTLRLEASEINGL